MKIIRVESCRECTDMQVSHGAHCLAGTKYRQIDDPDTIPDWCPLEDA
jgi:hypothetical protein